MELGYERAPVSIQEFEDGWTRIWRGKDIPDFSDEEVNMFRGWLSNGNIMRIVLYLTEPKYVHCLDEELCEFIIREVMRENIRPQGVDK